MSDQVPQEGSSNGIRRTAPTLKSASGMDAGRLRAWIAVAMTFAFALMVLLRVVALDSDAYPRLSWSGALLTDEGYYIHNARNLILFGQARMDGFNNMLIMPLLHGVQVVMFRIWGVGAVQARVISILLNLLSLPLFFAALRRAFDTRIAALATLFYGLDHITLLYSRMALMDIPAAALMIAAIYAFIRGGRGLIVCGLLLGLAYATRGLSIFLMPVVLAALWKSSRNLPAPTKWRPLLSLSVGLALILGVYLVFWYWPQRAEIAAASHYYLSHQLLPHSASQWFHNVLLGLFDYRRGMMPYLFRHSPVQSILALLGSAGWMVRAAREAYRSRQDGLPAEEKSCLSDSPFFLFSAWMLLFLVLFCSMNYMPSRYYVLFYPALAALAAVTLLRLKEILTELQKGKVASVLLAGYLFLLGGQAVLSRVALLNTSQMGICFLAISLLTWIVLFVRAKRIGVQSSARSALRAALPRGLSRAAGLLSAPGMAAGGVALWAAVNGIWTGDWLLNLTYRQRDADRWLAVNLPPNSVLFGDVAPGLCLNNHFQAVNVIPGLCNDAAPLEKHPDSPRYILMLDDGWREGWWVHHYPALVAKDRRIHAFPHLLRPFYTIGLYPGEERSASEILPSEFASPP